MTAPDVVTHRSPSEPAVGALLVERYRVLAKLGQGTMGSVFRAENVVTGKVVALKWLAAQSAAAELRLLREAQATARVRHPNLVDIYDVVRSDERLFLVMELLEGETLRDYLNRCPSPALGEIISLLLPALDGIAAAHALGVIHRDLKPENIFLVRDGREALPTAKVLDFGIAKLTHALERAEEDEGVLGTPLYMSAEQLRGDRDIDARTDVYAVGVILYEAITGQLPHDAQNFSELLLQVFNKDPVPVALRRPDVPAALARAVDWAIARQREQRLPSIRALMSELEPFAADDQPRSARARSAVLASATHAPSHERELAGSKRGEPELFPFVLPHTGARRTAARPWSALGLLVAALITLAGLLVGVLGLDRRPAGVGNSHAARHDTIEPEPEVPAAAAAPPDQDEGAVESRTKPLEPVIAAPDPKHNTAKFKGSRDQASSPQTSSKRKPVAPTGARPEGSPAEAPPPAKSPGTDEAPQPTARKRLSSPDLGF